MKEARILATALLLLAAGYLLERRGAFLYSGYGLVRIAGALVVLIFALWGFLVSQGRHKRPMLLGPVAGCALAALAWQLEAMPTSPRKSFYLETRKVMEGVPFRDAQIVMAPYRSYSVEAGHMSFTFRSAPQTEDVLIVHYDPTTMKVTKVELSLD